MMYLGGNVAWSVKQESVTAFLQFFCGMGVNIQTLFSGAIEINNILAAVLEALLIATETALFNLKNLALATLKL